MKHKKNYFINDVMVMFARSSKHITRSPDTIITTLIMPIAIMLLFVYVLGGAIQTGSENYINYQLPGILLITIGSGVSYTSYRLFTDKQRGIFERFHSMPIVRSTPLWGHVLTSLMSNVVSLVVVILVALLLGFRSSASIGSWLMIMGMLVLFTMSLTWLSVVAGLLAKTPDGASVLAYPLMFLPFLSSAFVPTESMPRALQIFAENQPVTSIVNAIRALIENQAMGNDIWLALVYCIVILIVSYCIAMKIYRKQS